MKFKILMASDIYFPKIGGISEHIYNLTILLRKRGHEVKILTGGYNKRKYRDYRDPEWVKRIGRMIPLIANKSISSITISPRISKKIKEFLEEEKFDIIHTHGPIAPMIPMIVLKHSNSINFATFHSAHGDSKGYRIFGKYLKKYFEKIHGLIAVSPAAKEPMEKFFPGNYRIIPNGVDTNMFSPHVLPFERFMDGKINILFVGRMEPRKGFNYLLKAFEILNEEFKNLRLIAVGKGPLLKIYKSQVKKELKDKVVFEGEVKREDLPRYYASADIFCSPAIGYESFGIVLLEAFSTGKPVVASRIPGYSYVLDEGKDSLLFEPKNYVELAEKLKILIKNKELRKEMGERGREKVLKNYSWDKIALDLENYYIEKFKEVRG
jgi:phosphatidylinositol alpha-mannosyltransferase